MSAAFSSKNVDNQDILYFSPMKNTLTAAMLLMLLFLAYKPLSSQDLPAYQIFSSKGKKISYANVIRDLAKADIVFIGEYHNNPIIHWLQLEITRDLGEKRNLILGAEMFEADNQEALNNYLSGKIDQEGLDSTARLWNNFKTDYAPLVNYAREHKLPFIATNIPRRHANLVYRQGFEALDSLPEEEKKWMAPLPIHYDGELPEYKKMMDMMEGHGSPTMPMAQASKDATMAYFIASNLQNESLFIHYNGAYHSDNHGSIVYYLKRDFPELKIVTLSTVEQESVNTLLEENKDLADFIVCIDEDMTKTY
jgi:uncharacterized iron-regulated protein